MPRMPIQDEPESTIGRKPSELHEGEPERAGSTRPGASTRREEGGETTEARAELRDASSASRRWCAASTSDAAARGSARDV